MAGAKDAYVPFLIIKQLLSVSQGCHLIVYGQGDADHKMSVTLRACLGEHSGTLTQTNF